MAIPDNVWLPLGTMIVGYSLNLVREGLRDRRKRIRVRDSREFRLKVRNQDRMAAFQRKALADLKEAVQKHMRLLQYPKEEPDEQRGWFNRLHENRVDILSLSTSLGDGELSKILHSICETSKGLESWVNDTSRSVRGDDRTVEEFWADYNSLQGRHYDAARRLAELGRDIA